MSRPGTLLALTVGTTEEPLRKAVEETDAPGVVVLLYGRSLDQVLAPLEVAARLRAVARSRGLDVREHEVSDPEDLTAASREIDAAVGPLLAEPWDAVRYNFTGGTKVLSGALLGLAYRTLETREARVEYTGGQRRDRQGRVAGDMKTVSLALWPLHARRALERFRQLQYQSAYAWGSVLPGQGEAGFVRAAMEAVSGWDRLEYAVAHAGLRSLSPSLGLLAGDSTFGPFCALLERLREAAGRAQAALHRLHPPERGANLPLRPVPHQLLEGMELMAVDALVNGDRRLEEGRCADAVLRGYRAMEVASQRALVAVGVVPWGAEPVGLDQGLRRLQDRGWSLGALTWEELRSSVQKVQHVRNYSFLEHGYSPVAAGTAQSLLARCEVVVKALLGEDGEQRFESARGLVSFRL